MRKLRFFCLKTKKAYLSFILLTGQGSYSMIPSATVLLSFKACSVRSRVKLLLDKLFRKLDNSVTKKGNFSVTNEGMTNAEANFALEALSAINCCSLHCRG